MHRLSHFPRIRVHVCAAHCQRQQFGWLPDGQYEIHTLGTGRDDKRTKYKMTRTNKHKQWDSSFLMIRDGFLVPLGLKNTDWRREPGLEP